MPEQLGKQLASSVWQRNPQCHSLIGCDTSWALSPGGQPSPPDGDCQRQWSVLKGCLEQLRGLSLRWWGQHRLQGRCSMKPLREPKEGTICGNLTQGRNL